FVLLGLSASSRSVRLEPDLAGCETGLEKMFDGISTAESSGNTDESGDDGAQGQCHQRIGHRLRRLVRSMPRAGSRTAMNVEARCARCTVGFRRPVSNLMVLLVRAPVRVRVTWMRGTVSCGQPDVLRPICSGARNGTNRRFPGGTAVGAKKG